MTMAAVVQRENHKAHSHPLMFFEPARSARRWITGRADFRLHAYVGADPVNWTDPDGLAKDDIIVTALPRPQNPPEPPRAGSWGPFGSAGGNPEKGEDTGAAECPDEANCVIVTAKKPPPFTRFVRHLGDILDRGAERHLRPPEGRRSRESRTECVSRIAGDTPALGTVGVANLAAGGAILPYPRTPLAGGGGGTSLISSAARGSFGGAKMNTGVLGTGSIGGAVGRAISRVSVVTGAAVLGWAAGKLVGAADKCR